MASIHLIKESNLAFNILATLRGSEWFNPCPHDKFINKVFFSHCVNLIWFETILFSFPPGTPFQALPRGAKAEHKLSLSCLGNRKALATKPHRLLKNQLILEWKQLICSDFRIFSHKNLRPPTNPFVSNLENLEERRKPKNFLSKLILFVRSNRCLVCAVFGVFLDDIGTDFEGQAPRQAPLHRAERQPDK